MSNEGDIVSFCLRKTCFNKSDSKNLLVYIWLQLYMYISYMYIDVYIAVNVDKAVKEEVVQLKNTVFV